MLGTSRPGVYQRAPALGGTGDGPSGVQTSDMPTPNPYWTDERGRRVPPKPCPKCGANVGPMPLRVEHLRHLGWQPYTVQSYQSWCGHTQEVIPFPREDGSVMFVTVVGEAS